MRCSRSRGCAPPIAWWADSASDRICAVGSLLLGPYKAEGKLDHVGFTSTISAAERPKLTRKLEALVGGPALMATLPEGRWSTERSTAWETVRPDLVVEVRYDHVTGGRFRHGTKLLRFRFDKAPRQRTFDQLQQEASPPKLNALQAKTPA